MQGVDYQRARVVLRERRFQLRMRVRDLAEKAGVERTTIYRLEKIEKEPGHEPDFKTLEKIATALDLTLSDFFLRIESLQPREAGVTVTPPPSAGSAEKHPLVSGFVVDTSSSPEADSQRLAALCLRAAERSERATVTGILTDMAHAFQLAAFNAVQWTQYQTARRQIADRRREASRGTEGDRSVG